MMTQDTHSRSRLPGGRLAGLMYLVVIAGALYGEAVVRGQLIVDGDPLATARAITSNEFLYRSGIAVALVYLAANFVVIWSFIRAFGTFRRGLTVLLGILFVVVITIETVNLVHLVRPLELLFNPDLVAAIPEADRAVQAMLSLETASMMFGVSLVYFGLYCLVLGGLILSTRLVPRVIGGLIMLGGAGYLVNTLALVLAPPVAGQLFPWVLLPAFVAEVSLAVWLLVFGFDARHAGSPQEGAWLG